MEILILLGLIILNGLFVMSEIALVSARKPRLETMAEKGDFKAESALRLSNNPEIFLSAAQIGITLIAILTGVYSEKKLIERIFHLGDRNITSLMTHRSDIIWFDLSDNEENIREKILQEPHSIYPICDGNIDNIKGMVSIKDLYIIDDFTLFKDVVQPALFVPENNTAYQVMEKFKETKSHSCFIVDEYGSLQGMITLNDIMEAIVGEIPTTGIEDYEILEREDGTFLVDAQIPFYDFLSRFDKADWASGDEYSFDTLAGCVLHELERIPQTGDKLKWRGFEIEVMDMDGHRIDKVLVKPSKEIIDEMKEE